MNIQLLGTNATGQSSNANAKPPTSTSGAFASNLAQAARQASGGEAGKDALTTGDDTARSPQRGSLGVLRQPLGDAPAGSGVRSEADSARLAVIAQRLALIEGVGRPGEGTAKDADALPSVARLDPLGDEALQALAEAANAGDTPDTATEASLGQGAERVVAMGGATINGPMSDAEPLRADRAALDALRHTTQQRNAEPLPAALATRADDIARTVEPGGDFRIGPAGERWVGSGTVNDRGESVTAALNGQPASGTLGQPASSATLTAPVNSPAWPQQLGQQLVMLGQRGGEQRVELHLHPAELGPLSISLKLSEQSAQLQFLSANTQVRGAVEQAIPQLREALAEQGISLGDTSVGEQRQDQQFTGSTGRQGAGSVDGGEAIEDVPTTGSPVSADMTLEGRVDLYA